MRGQPEQRQTAAHGNGSDEEVEATGNRFLAHPGRFWKFRGIPWAYPEARSVKISFVRPNLGDWRSPDAMEPLAFAVLKGVTPSDVECELWDEKIEAVPVSLQADLVALTVETYTARRAYALADRFRAQGLKVVAGGYHPTFLPQEALNHFDAVVCGDAEALWPQLVRDAAAGRL